MNQSEKERRAWRRPYKATYKEQETSRAGQNRPEQAREQGLANSQEAGSIYVDTFTLMRAFLVPISLRKKTLNSALKIEQQGLGPVVGPSAKNSSIRSVA